MDITKDYFLSTVKDHKMTIEQDNGVFRCIEFEKPGNVSYYFRLTTFPGYLVITGDCGNYVFRRLHDMFDFFRSSDFTIDPGYWAEKLDAIDKHSNVRVYSEELACKFLTEDFNNWCEENGYNEHGQDDLHASDSYDFQHAILDGCATEDGFLLLGTVELPCGYTCDTWEFDPYELSPSFIWCLYAIVWGIQQYDAYVLESNK